MKKVKVICGDLTQVLCDAIITAVNPGGMWFGGIDGAINRVAKDMFHDQVRKMLPLSHGATVVAKSVGKHTGKFHNVVFVIDALAGPLRDVIYNGLVAASKEAYKTVALPTIRMGVMLGQVEKTPEEAVGEMVGGVARFFDENPDTSIESITFVVYVDPDTEELLKETFAAMPDDRE
jgi:O-acetyl-ADP-ribose deacetylase (regulator of RNase III)